MTLPSRRKHPTTVQSSLRSSLVKLIGKLFRAHSANRVFIISAACLVGGRIGYAQQWQPTRIAPSSSAQPLAYPPQKLPASSYNNPGNQGQSTQVHSGGRIASSTASEAGMEAGQQLGTGVVLRWRASKSSSSASSNQATSTYDNPLRESSIPSNQTLQKEQHWVHPVSDMHPIDRMQSADNTYRTAQSAHFQEPESDPLDSAETAPEPPPVDFNDVLPESTTVPSQQFPDPPSFPPQLSDEPSPADRPSSNSSQPRLTEPEQLPSLPQQDSADTDEEDEEKSDEDALEELLEEARQASTPDCVTQREQLKGQPLSTISLDVSPKLGDGLRSIKKQTGNSQESRAQVDKKSLLREWTSYRGERLGSGRLTDLRFGNVILDVDGRERAIPVANLSDVDMSYVSELWNLPFRCGSGFEPLEGRQFVNSTVQWKASGACHNPLYFEQVQLERYGHETGPVLQPLISSAHFLLTIPMMPYKMAINPPNECQYALGYYRPGNCAPYMIQPFPWSVKAGLVQAGFWTGASALVP